MPHVHFNLPRAGADDDKKDKSHKGKSPRHDEAKMLRRFLRGLEGGEGREGGAKSGPDKQKRHYSDGDARWKGEKSGRSGGRGDGKSDNNKLLRELVKLAKENERRIRALDRDDKKVSGQWASAMSNARERGGRYDQGSASKLEEEQKRRAARIQELRKANVGILAQAQIPGLGLDEAYKLQAQARNNARKMESQAHEIERDAERIRLFREQRGRQRKEEGGGGVQGPGNQHQLNLLGPNQIDLGIGGRGAGYRGGGGRSAGVGGFLGAVTNITEDTLYLVTFIIVVIALLVYLQSQGMLGPKPRQLVANGGPCTVGTECESRYCNQQHVCGLNNAPNSTCTADYECTTAYCALTATNSKKASCAPLPERGLGEPCYRPIDCMSRTCVGAVCVKPPKLIANGFRCQSSAQCISKECDPSTLICVGNLGIGEACGGNDYNCESRHCSCLDMTCQPLGQKGLGETCCKGQECASTECYNSVCVKTGYLDQLYSRNIGIIQALLAVTVIALILFVIWVVMQLVKSTRVMVLKVAQMIPYLFLLLGLCIILLGWFQSKFEHVLFVDKPGEKKPAGQGVYVDFISNQPVATVETVSYVYMGLGASLVFIALIAIVRQRWPGHAAAAMVTEQKRGGGADGQTSNDEHNERQRARFAKATARLKEMLINGDPHGLFTNLETFKRGEYHQKFAGRGTGGHTEGGLQADERKLLEGKTRAEHALDVLLNGVDADHAAKYHARQSMEAILANPRGGRGGAFTYLANLYHGINGVMAGAERLNREGLKREIDSVLQNAGWYRDGATGAGAGGQVPTAGGGNLEGGSSHHALRTDLVHQGDNWVLHRPGFQNWRYWMGERKTGPVGDYYFAQQNEGGPQGLE